jgi:predicted acyltransferase
MTTLTQVEPVDIQAPERSPSTSTQRLMSVDALRGFDMFWIIGADALVYALNRMSRSGPTEFLANQLEHAEWEGFHFYDLIFPLFVFIVGVSLVFSLTKTIEQAGRAEALKRVVRRGILLFLIGIFYSGGFASLWPDMRLMGVLNRIALAYFFAGLLFIFFKPRPLLGICAGLLVGYWALMSFVPIRDIQLTRESIAKVAQQAGDNETSAYFFDKSSPNPSTVRNSPAWAATQKLFYSTTNHVTGKFGKGYNLSDHTDFQYLPGKKYDTFFDPEGILSTIPAIGTCLLGVFAGLLVKSQSVPDQRKVLYLVSFGIGAAAVGWLWNLQFPVIKKIWTSSYVLVAGGYSSILLGLFYLVVDVWQIRGWCQPFVWMGMNSITVYLTKNFLGVVAGAAGFNRLAARLVGGDIKIFFDTHIARGMGDLMVALVGLLLAFWFVHFLYRKKIFLRL